MKLDTTNKWWLFWLPTGTWITLNPTIYHPVGVTPEMRPAVLEHEKVHLKQQEGHLKGWLLKYIFSRKFRLDQEAEAIAVEASFSNSDFVIQTYVELLIGPSYLWAAKSKAVALKAIEEKIQKVAK
jgi:hypothetical protein